MTRLEDCPLCQKTADAVEPVVTVEIEGIKTVVLREHRATPTDEETTKAMQLLADITNHCAGVFADVNEPGHWGIKVLSGQWEQGKSSMYQTTPVSK